METKAVYVPTIAPGRRPRKSRTWLRTREVERLKEQNLRLDIIALEGEIRQLEVTRSLLRERERRERAAKSLVRPLRVALRPMAALVDVPRAVDVESASHWYDDPAHWPCRPEYSSATAADATRPPESVYASRRVEAWA